MSVTISVRVLPAFMVLFKQPIFHEHHRLRRVFTDVLPDALLHD